MLPREAVASGLLAGEAAARVQEELRHLKQQRRPPSDPLPFPVTPKDGAPPPRKQTCWTHLPHIPVCLELPEEYVHHSPQQALATMKQRLEQGPFEWSKCRIVW